MIFLVVDPPPSVKLDLDLRDGSSRFFIKYKVVSLRKKRFFFLFVSIDINSIFYNE